MTLVEGKYFMKIYIFGSVGSGKTTFAKKISKKLNINYYEVDCIVYKIDYNNRIKRTLIEQIGCIREIDKNNSWIIEGTYRESCDEIIRKADKIIFLDTSINLRIFRIIFRFIKQKIGIEKSHYKSNLKMLYFMFKWTFDFEKSRELFMNKLDKSKLIILKRKSDRIDF